MSKIGRRPIPFTTAKVEIKDNLIQIVGPKGTVEHELPADLTITQQDKQLLVGVKEQTRKTKMLWGLHRALLANKVQGVEKGFSLGVKIVGLGYKAQLAGKKLTFTLGYSHKIDYELPEGVSVEVDRSGQNLQFASIDKCLLGKTCDEVRKLRLPEPYKGTGIIREGDVIIRKAGKTKSA